MGNQLNAAQLFTLVLRAKKLGIFEEKSTFTTLSMRIRFNGCHALVFANILSFVFTEFAALIVRIL